MKSGSTVKAAPDKISKRFTVEQAFHKIAANCLGQIQANRLGLVERKEAESLHQMRVGLRRLDSALDLFADFFPLPKDLQTELDWLSKHLGAARDWDVLQQSTLPKLAGIIGPEEPALPAIKTAISDRAEEKYNTAIAAVESDRYRLLMQKFEDWLQYRDGRIAANARESRQSVARVPGFANAVLLHAQHHLLKRGEKLHHARPKERHKVRIAAKKARYAAEFFDALLAKKAAKRYVKSLASLQDTLGHLNDIYVAGGLLKELAVHHPNLGESIHFVRGYLAAYADSETKKINAAWRSFRQSDFPAIAGAS